MEKAGGQVFFLWLVILVLITCDTFKIFQFIWCCLWREESLVSPAYYYTEECNTHLRGIVRVKVSVAALFICIWNKLYLLISVLIPKLHQESWEKLDGFALFTSIIAMYRKDSYTIPFSCSCSSMHVYVCVLIYVVQRSCSCRLIFSSYSLNAKEEQIQGLLVSWLISLNICISNWPYETMCR